MEINLSELKESISRLSDEDLLKMLTENKDDYTKEALSIAGEEVQNRGGLEILKGKYQKQISDAQAITNEEKNRVELVRKNYRILDYAVDTLVRWLKYYGILVIIWFIFYRTGENLPLEKAILSGTFWLGMILIIFLSIVYSLIYAAINYKKAIKNMVTASCEKCGKVSIFKLSVIKMKVDNYHQYNTKCNGCQSELKVNLDFMAEQEKKPKKMPEQNIKRETIKDEVDSGKKIISTINITNYKGAFKREKWKLDLTPDTAQFYNMENQIEKIVISKQDIAKHATLKPHSEINLILEVDNKKYKFIIYDPGDFYNWIPR